MNLNGGAGMHDAATVGHLILVRVLGVVVVVHRMHDTQIEEQAILKKINVSLFNFNLIYFLYEISLHGIVFLLNAH